MKFQPGQSGNPAGRPPGARNKTTIAREQELAERASKAVRDIIDWAQRGHAVAMRIVAEWARPSGTNRSPALELPPITCSDDAQAALQTVLEAFASGALTSREGAGRQIRGELHPDMMPKPTGEPDPFVDALRAAGEDVPAYLATAAALNDHHHAGLYSPVNSSGESADAAAQEPASEPDADGLYFSVNSNVQAQSDTGDTAPPSPVHGEISGELQADAAVDDKLEAGDVAALLAREADGGPGDVEGVAAEPHGDLAGAGGPHLVEPAGGVGLREAGGMRDHGSLHQPGQDGVDADALPRDLDGR